jgi:small-conductance mechanosensitive channel
MTWSSAIVLCAIIFLPLTLHAASPMALKAVSGKEKGSESESVKAVELPANLDTAEIERIMATMSDDQVRRLLLHELRKQAQKQAKSAKPQEDIGALAGFIHKTREMFLFLQNRIEFLRSGVELEEKKELHGIFAYLGKGEKDTDRSRTIMTVIAVFIAGLIVALLFQWYTAGARKRLETTPPAGLFSKMGALSLRSGLDFLTICVFTIAVLATYYIFLERTTPQRVLVAAYLAAFLILGAANFVSRVLLAPKAPLLRFLPLSSDTALYLHRWILALTIIGSFGLLTCGIFRLAGTSEADHFKMVTVVGLIMAGMLIWMIVQKRKQVIQSLTRNLPEDSLRARLARMWHLFAIFGVFLLMVFGTLSSLLETDAQFPGLKTLLLIALYLLLDWILRQVLNVAFGIAEKPDDLKNAVKSAAVGDQIDEDADKDAELPLDTESEETKKSPLSISRMQRVLRAGLRIALAAATFFLILRVWGIVLPLGIAVVDSATDILVTVLVCYVAWEWINAAIQKRLKLEMPDDDEEMEEGGAGGSRIGTLLLLLRKFMLSVIVVMVTMIILSRLGIDIGPLIAGAGVIGLAIGFGAQTLVKDIIAGVFFLIDDAFRVGDYISVGSTKGMVEHISLRSFKLRHPRGMVNTIPFGSIGTVTNFSRDYIITKLDFRVRYDADVEKIRKIIKKKVYKVILKNEEMASKLLGKIKSQGVRQMDDSAMVMRVKFKTIPGEQFVIRKEVFRLMQEAFREAGIEFAHRNVTVYMPPETPPASVGETGSPNEEARHQAAAAAAQALLEEEEAAKKAAAAKSKK